MTSHFRRDAVPRRAWWTATELLMLVAEHGGDPMMARIAMMRALHRREPHEAQSRAGNAPKPTGSFDDRYQGESGGPILGPRGPFLTPNGHWA